jgi:hypothetical protein
MATLDFMVAGDIATSRRRIQQLLSCGIFAPENAEHPLLQSATIELIILASDLTSKAKNYSTRIDFKDEVDPDGRLEVTDVTDLLREVRNAVCHISSGRHIADAENKIKATFCIRYGAGIVVRLPNSTLISDHADDVAFFFGEARIYLRRHIIRATAGAWERLSPLLGSFGR